MEDKTFKVLNSHNNWELNWLQNPDWISENEFRFILTFLEEQKIIKQSISDNHIFLLTEHGKSVLKEQLILRKEKEEYEKISKQKLYNEAKLTKWKVKTFWPIFFFGLFGGIYSSFDFISKITNSNKLEKDHTEVISKIQVTNPDQVDLDSLNIITKKVSPTKVYDNEVVRKNQ